MPKLRRGKKYRGWSSRKYHDRRGRPRKRSKYIPVAVRRAKDPNWKPPERKIKWIPLKKKPRRYLGGPPKKPPEIENKILESSSSESESESEEPENWKDLKEQVSELQDEREKLQKSCSRFREKKKTLSKEKRQLVSEVVSLKEEIANLNKKRDKFVQNFKAFKERTLEEYGFEDDDDL